MISFILLNMALSGGGALGPALTSPNVTQLVQAAAAEEPAADSAHGSVECGASVELRLGVTFYLVLVAQKQDMRENEPPNEVVSELLLTVGLSRGARVAGWREQGNRYFFLHVPITGVSLTLRSMATPRAEATWEAFLRAVRRAHSAPPAVGGDIGA